MLSKIFSYSVHTPSIPEIIWVKNVRGNCGLWVLNEIHKKTYPENLKKIVGAVCELPAKYIAQPIRPNLSGNGLNWLCYLAGNSQTAPIIFFKFSGYVFLWISLRTHKPQLPSHF